MITINEAIKKIEALAPEIVIEVNNESVYEEIKKIDNAYNIKISPVVIFVITGDLNEEKITQYLISEYEIEEKRANEITLGVKEKIINPLMDRLSFLNANPEKFVNIEKEKRQIIDIFNKNIIKELLAHPIIVNAINCRIFYHLNINFNFKDEICNNLLSNEELLTQSMLFWGDKSVQPTISGWLNDFIRHCGSGLFSSVDLSSYLTNSFNAKKISGEERQLLIKVLNTYRNIKFFPESMPSDNGEGWEILPLDLEKYNSGKTEEINSVSPEPAFKEEGFGKANQTASVDSVNFRPRVTRVEELQKMLEMYPAGSIERKAIEAEIRKLNNV